MKILYVNTGPWGTGSFTLIKSLTKELLHLGHQVKIFFPDGNFESEDRDEYYGNTKLYKIWKFPITKDQISIENFPLMIKDPNPRNLNPVTFKSLSSEQQSLYEYELKKHLFNLIQEYQPDVIECQHIWYPAWILNQLGFPYFLTAHHSDQIGFRFDEKVRGKAIKSAVHAKKIIAISESVKQEVAELYGVTEEKIELIPNGYEREIFKVMDIDKIALLKKAGIELESNAQIINFVGKLSFTKGIDVLLQANRLIPPSQNIHFLVLGTGDIKPILEIMAPDSFSLKNIHLLGHQSPEIVAKFHNISKLSVMPSRTEGFGISCLEAMGCGLPMVVTKCGGPENFAVGKIVDKESASQLANAILDILSLSDSEYLKLSEKALAVAAQYSTQTTIQQRIELYKQ